MVHLAQISTEVKVRPTLEIRSGEPLSILHGTNSKIKTAHIVSDIIDFWVPAQYFKSKSTFLLVWQPFFHKGKLKFLIAIEQVIKQLSSHEMHFFYKA